jgi:hypothetical protein
MRKSRFSEEQIAYAPRPLALAPACKKGRGADSPARCRRASRGSVSFGRTPTATSVGSGHVRAVEPLPVPAATVPNARG